MKRNYSAHQAQARRKKQLTQYIVLAVLILLIIAAVVGLSVHMKVKNDRRQAAIEAANATPVPTAVPTPSPVPTPEPTPVPTPLPNAVNQPAAPDGWLPVFKSAKTDEKMIAITVDDCFQAENLREIIDTAMRYGGKLTFFPIGDEAIRTKQSEYLRYAYDNGFELENHTYTHNALYNVTDEKLAEEVYKQNLALSSILGVEYQVHFLRPRGGDARNDQRIHAYAKQLGYKGIAHWAYSGSGNSIEELKKHLTPGTIYLFHTTDKDLRKLKEFIPYAVTNGFRLVTMNEMFGYPPNETKPLTKPIDQYEIPPLEPYEVIPVTFKRGSYAYGVIGLQENLIALGYLDGEADGIYGESCEEAVKSFQLGQGMEVTGVADIDTQAKIKALAEKYGQN